MKRAASFAFICTLACDALATEGALEINQACVAGGCFSGDGPGLPVEIVRPGTYVMTSNLSIGAAETAITVGASNVTIEMQGFRIVGPASCTLVAAYDLRCTPNVTARGIDSATPAAPRNLTVRNGTITGTGTALLLAPSGTAENVVVSENTAFGIDSLDGATTLRGCIATRNGGVGLEGRTVLQGTATENAGFGIAAGVAGIVRDTLAFGNAGGGIYDFGGTVIANVTVAQNGGIAGIVVAHGGSSVLDSVITWNAGPGIRFEGGDALGGVKPATVGRTTLTANAGGNASAQWQGPGAVIELGANVCGSDTSCP